MKDEKDIYSDNDMWNRESTDSTDTEIELPREIGKSGVPESYNCKCGNNNHSDFHVDDNKGEVSCNQCGTLILENMIDPSAPTRRFSSSDPSVDNAHYGAPASNLFADKGLRTTFNPMEANRKDRQKSFILKRINQQTVTNKERNLAVALRDIERVISRGGLTKSVHQAAVNVYRDAVDLQLIRGRSIEGMVAASIYTACRIQNVPRSLDEVADLTRTGRKEIARNYNTLKKNIVRLKRMPPTTPDQYLKRYIFSLNLSLQVENRANELLKTCFEGGMNQGRNPIGVVAACIYIACVDCDERRTQRQIARKLEITEVTIRNRYKEAMSILNAEKKKAELENGSENAA
jgi:transcription initiation factor TFIIB